MNRRRIPAELRNLVRDDWSTILTLNIDRAEQEELIRELWHVDESGHVMHPRLQGTASEWSHNDLPARRYSVVPRVIHPDPISDRFNREEFEANPDSSDSSDSENEISTPPSSELTNHVTVNEEQSSSDSENDDSKNSTPNHVLAMLNRVQGLNGS